ncbi:MAG: DUF4340 domain-containing protein [Sedimentisphaerales bacterium]|jgi:hypothetical protein
MSNRNLLILGFAAAAMVALAVVVAGIGDKPYARKDQTAYLIQGLDPDQVARITIGKPGEEVILNRRGANFVVANLDNYPARTSEINKLITNCLDIQTAELYTDNPANHKDLGVTEPNATVLVKFYKAAPADKTDLSLITGLIVGKEKQRGRGIGYIRRVDDNKVYVAAAQIPMINRQAMDYVAQGLTSVKREDINSVTVSCPNDTYLLLPGDDDKTVILENLAEGKKLNNVIANRVFTALANLSFEDVNAESSKRGLLFDRRYLCRLKDTTVYSIWLAKDAGLWFAKCDARFADQTPVTKTQGEVESDEQLKIKEAKLLARDAAEQFSETHKGWVYQIPDYLAANLTRTSAELLESAKPVRAEVNEPSDTAAEQ